MGALDYIILGILLLAAVLGAMKGFVRQIGTIAGLVLGVIVCHIWGGSIADALVSSGSEHEAVFRVLIYTLVFAAVFLGASLIASLFGKVLSALHVRVIDRVAGSVFSVAATLLVMSVVLNVYLTISPETKARFDTPSKPWRTAVAKFAPTLMGETLR